MNMRPQGKPVIYIDAIHYSVRDNSVIVKKVAYVILGLTKDVRKIIYTTNAIESLNSSYRKLNRQLYRKDFTVSNSFSSARDRISITSVKWPSVLFLKPATFSPVQIEERITAY